MENHYHFQHERTWDIKKGCEIFLFLLTNINTQISQEESIKQIHQHFHSLWFITQYIVT